MVTWSSLGCSVIGASHQKRNIENQDAVNCGNIPELGIVFVAAADGHGSKKYIRSSTGSALAVNTLEVILKDCTPLHLGMQDIDSYVRHIKSRFLLTWQQCVDATLQQLPFSVDEKAFLQEHCSEKDINGIEDNPRIAFGCTFLCAVSYNDVVLILHHGDGDVLGLYDGDTLAQDIVVSDSRNFAGNTLSLGSLSDASEIGHRILTKEHIPKLITISTDGIKNSYNDKISTEIEQFYKIPVAIKHELSKREDIEQDLSALLQKITNNGSGDDVTIGILYKKETT